MTPRGRKSTVASPPSWSRVLRSISREPKPRCTGVVTCWPPASVQISRSLRPSLPSKISQSTATVPVSFDSAPYLAALVAISCTIIASTTASRGDSGKHPHPFRSVEQIGPQHPRNHFPQLRALPLFLAQQIVRLRQCAEPSLELLA